MLRVLVCGLLLGAPLAAQAVLHTHSGAAGAGLSALAAVGDLDLDGQPDYVLGAPEEAAARGRVTAISGASHAALFSVAGLQAGERFGAALAPAGDVNGDGRPDVLAGAPGTGAMTGWARVLSGADGSVLRTLTGNQAGARFGAAVAGAGDSNLDGKADLLVGAPGYDTTAGGDQGQATLWSGATGTLLYSAVGAGAGDHLGAAVGGCSMVDMEPIEIIGLTQEGTSGPGGVQIRARSNFALLATIAGPSAGSAFGASIARLGDVDGDGKGDVAVGAPGGSGSVRVLSGADWSALLTLSAPAAGTGFGSAVAAIGDVNGDGRADLACGAPLTDKNGIDSGEIIAYSGATGSLVSSIVGGAAGDRLGTSAAYVGDVDANGRADFAIASPGADGAGVDSGIASVIALSVWNTVENGLPGVAGIPRLTGDGGVTALTSGLLSLDTAPSITGATLVVGLSMILDAAHGVFVPMPDIVVTGLLTSASGTLQYEFAIPAGLGSGSVIYQQFLLADPSAPGGVVRSNTVAATVP